jgi:hypothetical protein
VAIWWWTFPPRPPHGAAVTHELVRVPRTQVADVPDGAARKISGRIEREDAPIRSPLTGTECSVWAITIDEVGGMGDSVLRGAKCQGVPFRVRDASGVARVIPDGARLGTMGKSFHYLPGALLIGYERELFAELSIKLNYPRTSNLRFTERIIAPAAEVTVYGYCQREPDRAAVDADVSGYRGDVPTQPVLSSTRRAPLLIG